MEPKTITLLIGEITADYAGKTLEVIDGTTGEVGSAQFFVAALGASSYAFADASFTQECIRLDRFAHARSSDRRSRGPSQSGRGCIHPYTYCRRKLVISRPSRFVSLVCSWKI
jgi:hypothetical protein